MIDWNETERQLNRTDLNGRYPKVVVKCDQCGNTAVISIRKKHEVNGNNFPWICRECVVKSETHKQKSSDAARKLWNNTEYRTKVSQNIKIALAKKPQGELAEKSRQLWTNEEYRSKMHMIHASAEYRSKLSANGRKIWEDDNYRKEATIRSQSQWQDPGFREKESLRRNDPSEELKRSASSKKRWANPAYRKRMLRIIQSKEYALKMAEASKSLWNNPEYRKRIIEIEKLIASDPQRKLKAAEYANEYWKDPASHIKASEISRKRWATKEYRQRMAAIHSSDKWLMKMAAIHASQPHCSSLQVTLYSILDDLGIKYYREYPDKAADPECTIGPWTFDCVIPRPSYPALLIECNGNWTHSGEDRVRRDLSKANYIRNKYYGQYELKYIWEHEFNNYGKVVELVKYWLGITKAETIDFDFKAVSIKPCPACDYKLLLSKYHYLPNAGRGGIAYGAYYNDELIATCIFSPLVRQNIAKSQGCNNSEIRELSRLCIHPSFQKHNFASWFVSRCLKALSPIYRRVISYCDTTFNHNGAVYKACNFRLDGEIPPDYWYRHSSGWVMHKKKLYNHARSLRMSEHDYATKFEYVKVYGDRKLRFIYDR